MQTQTSGTLRRNPTSYHIRKPSCSGPQHLELRKQPKNLSLERSHRARLILVLDTASSYEKVKMRQKKQLSGEVHASILKAGRAHTDNSKEVIKAWELQWTRDANSPRRLETNGISERAVRRVKERTATAMVQKWPSRRMVGLRDAMLLLLATRARQAHTGKDSVYHLKDW